MNSETIEIRRREVFFNNLIILGIDIEDVKKNYKITLNRDMFSVHNKKAFEVVSQFLFSTLNSLTTEDFSIVWPLYEKQQEKEFRETCFQHLVKISKDETSTVRFPPIVRTMFLSPGGGRFYKLYLAFTTYVMLKYLQKRNASKPLSRPRLTPGNHKAVKNVLQLQTTMATKNFTYILEKTRFYEEKWQAAADEMVKYNRRTNQSISQMEKALSEIFPTLYSLCPKVQNLEDESEKFEVIYKEEARRLAEVESLFQEVFVMLEKEKSLWDIVGKELESQNPEKFTLDGHELNVAVPEVLKRECKKELHEMEVDSLFQDGNLSLNSFFKLGQASLQHFRKVVEGVGNYKQDDMEQELTDNLQKLRQSLNSAKALRENTMSEILPKLSRDYKEVQSTVYSKYEDANKNESGIFNMPTPKLTFSPSKKSFSQDSTYTFTPPTDPKEFLKKRASRRSTEHYGFGLNPAENKGHLKPNIYLYSNSTVQEGHNTVDSGIFSSKNSTSLGLDNFSNVKICIDEGESSFQQISASSENKNDYFNMSSFSCFSPVATSDHENNQDKPPTREAKTGLFNFSSGESNSMLPDQNSTFHDMKESKEIGRRENRSSPLNLDTNISNCQLTRVSLLLEEDDILNGNCSKSSYKSRGSYIGHDWAEHITLDDIPNFSLNETDSLLEDLS